MQTSNPSLKSQPFFYLHYRKSTATLCLSQLIIRDQKEQNQVNYMLLRLWLLIHMALSMEKDSAQAQTVMIQLHEDPILVFSISFHY